VKTLGTAIAAASKCPPLDDLMALPGTTWLVPGNLPTLVEAEQALLVSMAGSYARHVDHLVQQEILDGYGGLWAVASGAFSPRSGRGSLIELLQKAITARARKAVSALLENYDAATLLLSSPGGEDGAWDALRALIKAAQPAAASPNASRLLLVALPSTPAGDRLRESATRALAETPATIVSSAGDILVCQETAGVSPSEALAGLKDANVAWAPLAARVSTRTDVVWSGINYPAS
jgi:hypothetical protein